MRWPVLDKARTLRQRRLGAVIMATINALAWALGGPFAFTIATAVNLGVWWMAFHVTNDELKQLERRSDDNWPRLS